MKKKTIVEKVYILLKENNTLNLNDIYTKLPEHSKASIRGNINRHIANSKTKLFIRTGKGIYTLNTELQEENKCIKKVKVAKVVFLEQFRQKRIELFSKIHNSNELQLVAGMDNQISLFDNLEFNDNHSFDEAEAEYGYIYRKIEKYNVEKNDTVINNEPKELFSLKKMLNKVMHMDAIEFLKSLPDKCVDLLITDPPYPVISGGSSKKKGTPSGILQKNDGKIFEFNDIKLEDWIPEVFRVMKDDTQGYIMTNLLNLDKLMNICQQVGFKIHNLLVWKKNNATPNRWFMKNCEYILFVRKGRAKSILNKGSMTVHEFDNIIGNKLHPTEKPLELANYYVGNSVVKDGVLLDPFCGLGAFIVSGVLHGMNFLTSEIDSKYFNLAKQRISNAIRLGYDDRSLLF